MLGEKLTLYLRFPVGENVSRSVAIQRLGEKNLWDARYHVLTPKLQKIKSKHIDISDVALQLRFEGSVDHLPSSFTGRNLQQTRKLTEGSAALLEKKWSSSGGDKPKPDTPVMKDLKEKTRSVPIENFPHRILME